MSRVIKFRAWDKWNKAMLTRFDIDGEGTNKIRNIRLGFHQTTEGRIITTDTSDVVLMQFTGLLDAKGNEIWEGDIVKRGVDHENRQDIHWEPWEVGHSPWGFYQDTADLERYIERGDNYSVIGNIYENPELLTKKEV